METGFDVFELNHPWVGGGPAQRLGLYVFDHDGPLTDNPDTLVITPGMEAEISIPFGSWSVDPVPEKE